MSRYGRDYEDSIDRQTGQHIAEIIEEHARYTEQTMQAFSDQIQSALKEAYNDKLGNVARKLNDNFQEAIATSSRGHGIFSGQASFNDESIVDFFRNTDFLSVARNVQYKINEAVSKFYRIRVSTPNPRSEAGRTSSQRYARMMEELDSIARRYQNRSDTTLERLSRYQENPSYEMVINKIIVIINGASGFFRTYVHDLDEALSEFLGNRRRLSEERKMESKKARSQSKAVQEDAATRRRRSLEDQFY